MTTRQISRRAFQSGMLSAFSALAAAPWLSRAAAADERITYFTWAGYDQPAFHESYDEKYGSEPNYTFFSDSNDAFQKVAQGFTPDVAHPCLPHIVRWHAAGLLKPIDPSRIAEWDNIIPAMRENTGVHFDGAYWMAPWEWGASSLIYRTDAVTFDKESYAIMLDPRYEGRIAALDNVDEMSMLASLLAGVEDPYDLDDSDFEAIGEKMNLIVRQSRFLWSDPTVAAQAMASGEIDMMWGWPNTWSSLVDDGVEVGFMQQPSEGMISWMCGFVLVADAKGSEDEAYDFINSALEPASGKALIETFGYGHSNLESFKLVAPERLREVGLSGDVATFIAESNFLRGRSPEQNQRLITMWDNAKIEASM